MKSALAFLFISVFFSAFALPSLNLEPQVALVLEADDGKGLSTAKALIGDSFIVYAAVSPRSDRALVHALLARFPKKLRIVEIDPSMQASIAQAIKKIISREGRLDLLVDENRTLGARKYLEDIDLSRIKITDV